ncbi:MAG: ComEC/Rec2 family competence protein [Phycisphaerae bacterium]
MMDKLQYVAIDHLHPTRWLRTDPMIIVTALFISGVILGRYTSLPTEPVWIVGCILWLTSLVLFSAAHIRRYNTMHNSSSSCGAGGGAVVPPALEYPYRYRPWALYAAWSCLALTVVLCGLSRWRINQDRLGDNDIARAAPAQGRRFITARMLITSEPEFHPLPPRGILFSAVEPSTTFFARVLACRVHGRWIHTTGNAVVRVPGYLPALRNNQYVQLTGWLARPPRAANPGGFDYRQYLTTFRVFAAISAAQVEQIRVQSNQQTLLPLGGWLDAWRAHLRRRLIADHSQAHRTDGYALIALLLGYRDPTIRPLARAFSRAGAAHLLALSGMHVVIIAAAIWMILKLFIPRPRYRALVTLVFVLMYMFMTPCGPPVVRAAIGTSLVLISWMLGRPVRALNILAATALLVTLWRPAELWQPPFQLSFIVTLGLIVLARRVYMALFHQWLTRKGDLARAVGTRWAAFKVHALAWITAIITANMIGSFVALPLVAYHYNQFNPLAVVNGLILLPLVAAALLAGLIEMAAGFGAPALGRAAAAVAGPVAHLLAWTVAKLAALPASEIIVRSPPMFLILFFFLILLGWMFRRNIHLRRGIIAGSFAVWTVGLVSWYSVSAHQNGAHVWVLNVGTGDAVVIHARQTVLLDAGSLGSPTRLTQEVNTALRKLGLWRLDRVIITQIDSTHAAAVPIIIRRHGGLSGWCDPMDCKTHATASTRFLMAAAAAGLKLQPVTRGQTMRIGKHTRIKVLWPAKSQPTPQKLRGLILLLRHRRQRVVFLTRTQGVDFVLNRLNIPGRITGVVLLGAGTIHASLAHWLVQRHPHWIITTGETRAASLSDCTMLAHTSIRLFQTRHLGAIHIILRRQKTGTYSGAAKFPSADAGKPAIAPK